MAFVKFNETARSYKPIVSIRSGGSIGLSSGLISKFVTPEAKFVSLYYDSDKKTIGIKPTVEAEDGSHRLNRGKVGAWVGARRFLDYINYSSKKTFRTTAEWDAENNLITIQI